MGRKFFSKKWNPDPKLAPLLKPFYDRGFPAYVASGLLLRDHDDNIIKNPNVKTYFKYWKFWKTEALEKQRIQNFRIMRNRQKEFELKYITAYDKLILVAYEMETTLESCRKYKTTGLFDNIPVNEIDLKLEIMIYRVTKLWTSILLSRYTLENDIILYKLNEKTMNRNLRKINSKTHMLLLRVVQFLSKRESRKAILDCQINEKTPKCIVIKCGICQGMVMPQCRI